MTKQQIMALENPCEFAEQCMDRRFFSIKPMDCVSSISTILTVNIGEE